MTDSTQWRRCSACKNPIGFNSRYWVCNVSTCNRKRTALAFCSVTCWEVHLPGANHRESWAEERMAPAQAVPTTGTADTAPSKTGVRRIVREAPVPAVESDATEDILVIASRLKDYIRARSGFNTSERVLAPLSAIIRRVCDAAIANATRDERKTVLDRDIPME
jgi:histone H3/H4